MLAFNLVPGVCRLSMMLSLFFIYFILFFFFFFQAEDGIRDLTVTGVQTCALPISTRRANRDRGTGVVEERDFGIRERDLHGVVSRRHIGEGAEEGGIGLQTHQVNDGRRGLQSLCCSASWSQGDAGNGNIERKDRGICWKCVGYQSKADRGVAAPPTTTASGLSMKVAGRKGETREHDYEKQRFVANHPTPHDRPVCDSLLYLLPTRRRKNSRLNLNAEGKGRHSKNGRSIGVLNILKEERCATM